MSKTNLKWAKEQLESIGASVAVQEAVRAFLGTWESVQKLDDDQAQQALDVFYELAKGHSLTKAEEAESWEQAVRGNIVVGDIVRIRPDAFVGVKGTAWNGRVGKVVAIRYGSIVFRSTDSGELMDGIHFTPDDLEKRVK